jgi:hypothetical protein
LSEYEGIFVVSKDEMWPVYDFVKVDSTDGDIYQLPVEMVEEYMQLLDRLKTVGAALFAYASGTGQTERGSRTL